VYGTWPKNQIDHIDGDRANNRISNLRDVSQSINQQNLKRSRVRSKSGFLGVSPSFGRFRAAIRLKLR
jgi:hypothetical protein